MPDLKKLLDSPISWQAAARNPDIRHFLQDLQANILKSHGRHHAGHVFISFQNMQPDAVASLVRQLGAYCTSAYTQLRTNKKYPPYLDGGPVRCLFLSATGYKALGRHAKTPPGDAFAAGMENRKDKEGANILGDPPRAQWDRTGWREHAPDAMFLVADANANAVSRDLQDISGWLNGTGARILVIERGLQQTRQFRPGQKAEAVEHFGYVDGRSQPLFLHEDLEDERASIAQEPNNVGRLWDPEFKPSQFIVSDPNGTTPLSAGSFFVFRKLEQDIRGFNAAEDALGRSLFGAGATSVQLDRAGAMIVGRFEDGTPLVLEEEEKGRAVPNGFTFDNDAKIGADGIRCPFHAHIRKVNPRGDVKRTFNTPDESGDRAPIMARRGITYGPERPKTPDGRDFADEGSEPQHDSGLLFMAYMASLEAQFEFTQQSWANNADFVVPKNGVDPIIGQTNDPAGRQYTFQDKYTPGMQPKVAGFDQFVHMLGGEYFFAPSLSFLRGVGL